MDLKVISHSSKEKLTYDTDIYLVDTFGETSKFYNLTNVAFIGGSTINHGGQNPLEAARLGNYIISGSDTRNFTEIYAFLKKNKLSFTTDSISEMKKIILKNINKKILKKNREKIFNNGNKILKKNIFFINKYLA